MSFHLSDPVEYAYLANNSLTFEMPEQFSSKSLCSPTEQDYSSLLQERMPRVVQRTLLQQLPRAVPINPVIAFGYAKESVLPPFVINYFMSVQAPGRPISKVTRFFRALHMIEAYRGNWYALHPEDPLPPPTPAKKLSRAALRKFFETVDRSLQHNIDSGTFDPMTVEQSAIFLEDLRRAAAAESPDEPQPSSSGASETLKAAKRLAASVTVEDVLRAAQKAKQQEEEKKKKKDQPKPDDKDEKDP